MFSFSYFKALCGGLGFGSFSGAAAQITAIGSKTGIAAVVTAMPNLLPALLLGALYVLEALVPDKYWDHVGRLGAEALHVTTSTLALLSIWMDLRGSENLGVALHAASGSIALYTALLVMSLYKLVKSLRGRKADDTAKP